MGVKEHLIEIGIEIGFEEGQKIGWKIGWKHGREQAREEMIKNLLAKENYTCSKIADLAGVSEAYVRKIKRTLKL